MYNVSWSQTYAPCSSVVRVQVMPLGSFFREDRDQGLSKFLCNWVSSGFCFARLVEGDRWIRSLWVSGLLECCSPTCIISNSLKPLLTLCINERDMLQTLWEKDRADFILVQETDPFFPVLCNRFHAPVLTVCFYLFFK